MRNNLLLAVKERSFTENNQISIKNQKNDFYCGPAVIQSILNYHQENIDQETLAQKLKTSKELGSATKEIKKVFSEYNFKIISRQNGNEKILKKHLKKYPVILLITIEDMDSKEGHYILAVNYLHGFIEYEDPLDGKTNVIMYKDLESIWSGVEENKNKWYCVVKNPI